MTRDAELHRVLLSADEYIHYDNSLNRPLDLDDVIDYPSRVLRMINNHIEYYNPVSTDSVEGDIKYYEKAGEVPGGLQYRPWAYPSSSRNTK